MYMVTRVWRGAMHVDPMRSFPTEDEAQAYANELNAFDHVRNLRIYLLSPNQPPVSIKIKLKTPGE